MKLGWILVFSTMVSAQEKDLDLNPHFTYTPPADSLQNAGKGEFVQTRERDITIGGIAYRQIEYKGEVFVVNAKQPDTAVDCTNAQMPPESFAVDAKAEITKRTKFFIESLRQHCDPVSRHMVTSPNARDANIGVKFEGATPESSEKKIFVNPIKRTGGAGITF